VHAFAHVTGGGIAANLARVIPAGLVAVVDRSTWAVPPVFGWVAGTGGVPAAEMERTFNQGIGMIAVVAAGAEWDAVRLLAERDVPAWVAGEVRPMDSASATASSSADAPVRAYLTGTHST
jgi:phosphoribosylformylglycinamidine cyclo-ligase